MNPDDPLGLISPPQKKAANDPLGLLDSGKPHLPTKLELAQRNATQAHPEDAEEPEAGYATQALGGLASLARDIPGAEAAQAGARSLLRRQPYREALSDIRGAEGAAPKWVRRYNRVAGATVAAAVAPGSSALKQGALYGATSGALAADPMTAGERVGNTAKEAAVGATAGKLFGELLPIVARTQLGRSLGRTALSRDAEMAASDATNYSRAASEGTLAAANPTPPATVAALNDPDVRPYANIIRNSRLFRGADDATILRESYKLMSERQGLLGKRVLNSDDFRAGTELERAEIGSAKRDLLTGADHVMPSFRSAVYEHAALSRDREAFRTAADATKRITRGASGAARKASQNSPESFMDTIRGLNPSEANAATEGVLGRLKERTGFLGMSTANPLKLFGLPKSSADFAALAPYLRVLDERAGNTVAPPLGRALAIALSQSATR